MRAIFLVGCLSLILTNATAGAQSGLPPKSATLSTTPTANDQMTPGRTNPTDQERIAAYLAQCLNDWDAATHMTKLDWARVCRRVIDNRVKFRLETGFRLPDLR